jgi:uncharacterized DUF497 family protein
MFFIWDDLNIEHIGKHRVETHEAQFVVRHPKRPYPRSVSAVKWLVKGRTAENRRLQVIYVIRDPEAVDVTLLSSEEKLALEAGEEAVYVVHARPLRRGER